MAPSQLNPRTDIAEMLSSESLLLFKHSPTCPVSAQAFFEYRSFCGEHSELQTLWLDVIEQRAASLTIAQLTGVTHESPQALWMVNGAVVWHASHGGITNSTLREALGH